MLESMGLQRVGHGWATEQQEQSFIHNVSTLGCFMETIAIIGHNVGFQGYGGNESGKTVPQCFHLHKALFPSPRTPWHSGTQLTRLSSQTLSPPPRQKLSTCGLCGWVRGLWSVSYLALKSESFCHISVVPGLCCKGQHGPQCQDKTGMTWECVSSAAHTQTHLPCKSDGKIQYPSQNFCQFARGLNRYGYRDGWERRGYGHGGGRLRGPGGDGSLYLEGGGACTNLHVWKNYTHSYRGVHVKPRS